MSDRVWWRVWEWCLRGMVWLAIAVAGTSAAASAAAAQDHVEASTRRERLFVPDLASIVESARPAAASRAAAEAPAASTARAAAIRLALFPDTIVDIDVDRRERLGPDQVAMVGHVANTPLSAAYLIVDGDTLAADIILPTARYEVRRARDGGHVARQIDPARALDCALERDDDLTPRQVETPSAAGRASASTARANAPSADDMPADDMSADDTPAVVDLLVVYTPAAETGAGGAAGLRSAVALALTQTNDALQRSGVSHRFRLVHTARIAYVESGNINTDQLRVRTRDDGVMDDVFALRDSVGADLVTLVVDTADHAGVANVLAAFDQDTETYPLMSTVVRGALSTSLPHELGHNAGLLHDRDNAVNRTPILPYGFGYRLPGRWSTIMAYANCGAAPCPRIPYYSNPLVLFEGTPTGVDDYADEARVLRRTMPIVATERASCVTALTPRPGVVPSSGGALTIDVIAGGACTWTADPLPADATWVARSFATSASIGGRGNGSAQYTLQPNASAASRTTALTINGSAVAIEQAGCTVTPVLPAELPAAGGRTTIAVQAAATCAWQAAGVTSATPLQSGVTIGPGSFDIQVARNDGAGVRAVTFSLNGQPVSIAQAARATASTFTAYLAEGATGSFFSTRLALFNPSVDPSHTVLRFLRDDGGVVTQAVTVPAKARLTLLPETVSGLEASSFSTVIESSAPVIVDRTMTWDKVWRYGSSAETAVANASTTWYLAEGSTSGDFSLFYLLQNPNPTPVRTRIRYLRPFGLPPIEQVRSLPPSSRTTIAVDDQGPELAATDLSAVITADAPIMVERSMYRTGLSTSGRAQPFVAGHESAGVTAPALHWFLAEGATGPFFDLFILLANPQDRDADVSIDYLLLGGDTLTKRYTVPANGRLTIAVDAEEFPGVPGRPLDNVAVSSDVTSTNGVPILVERTMWWPSPAMTPAYWTEAHNSPGARETGTRWALAEGEVGGPDAAETFILIANTSSTDGVVRVTLYYEGGGTAERRYHVAGRSRSTVPVAADFPESAGRRFGAIVESLRGPVGAPPPPQIVVERAMYTSPDGHTWAAGTNALARRVE